MTADGGLASTRSALARAAPAPRGRCRCWSTASSSPPAGTSPTCSASASSAGGQARPELRRVGAARRRRGLPRRVRASPACRAGMWRFSGFGEIKRLTLACLVAGAAVRGRGDGARLREVPRAVLALHPVVTLMGLCMVRVALPHALRARALAHHRRRRGESRRALVMGAGEAARLLLAGIQHQGWIVLGAARRRSGEAGRAHRRRAGARARSRT